MFNIFESKKTKGSITLNKVANNMLSVIWYKNKGPRGNRGYENRTSFSGALQPVRKVHPPDGSDLNEFLQLVFYLLIAGYNSNSSNPTQTRCTRYNIMWLSLSVTYGRSVVVFRVLRFPLPIKLTFTIQLKYCWKWRSTP